MVAVEFRPEICHITATESHPATLFELLILVSTAGLFLCGIAIASALYDDAPAILLGHCEFFIKFRSGKLQSSIENPLQRASSDHQNLLCIIPDDRKSPEHPRSGDRLKAAKSPFHPSICFQIQTLEFI